MSDILREIDDELQRERMALVWHRYKYLIVGVIAFVVLGTASHAAWRTHHDAAEVARSVALGSVISNANAKDEEKIEAFHAFAQKYAGTGQGLLAQMTAAGIAARSGKTPEALKYLTALADNSQAPDMARQYARLVMIELQIDSGDPVQLRAQLDQLSGDKQPWRFSARMLQGVLYGKHGDYAKARDIFTALGANDDMPVTLREEAKILARYYGTQG